MSSISSTSEIGVRSLNALHRELTVRQTPIFVISLARSQDRRTRIAARLQELSLEFEFFDAVDGKDLSDYHHSLVDYSFADFRKTYGRPLSNGEVGCALSHALLYKKIVDENIPHAVILEDDALPNTEFAALIKDRTLLTIPEIGLATFCYQPISVWRWSRLVLTPSIHAWRPMEHPWLTSCYYLTQALAADLLGCALPVSRVADWPAQIHTWSSTYCVTPLLVETSMDPAASTLHLERDLLWQDSDPPTETMALVHWKTPLRILGRLVSLTMIPSLLWPDIFGTVDNTKRFASNSWKLLKILFFGKNIKGFPV